MHSVYKVIAAASPQEHLAPLFSALSLFYFHCFHRGGKNKVTNAHNPMTAIVYDNMPRPQSRKGSPIGNSAPQQVKKFPFPIVSLSGQNHCRPRVPLCSAEFEPVNCAHKDNFQLRSQQLTDTHSDLFPHFSRLASTSF